MLHGKQRGKFDLSFRTPAQCADALKAGEADLGIVPVVEVVRQDLAVLPGVGIACKGPVRSIFLISRVAPEKIRTLAADLNSRTSVLLSQVILSEKFGAEPEVLPALPDMEGMLHKADAALIIGDNALRIDPACIPYRVWDLGEEWTAMTGLPMVFALWAGPRSRVDQALAPEFIESSCFGMQHLDDIVREQAPVRQMPEPLIREYLTKNVLFPIGAEEMAGLNAFLSRAARFDMLITTGKSSL